MAEDVCANAEDSNEITFDDFGNWYNSRGFELAPWLELLDLTTWPVDGRGELQDESDEEEEDDVETASRAVWISLCGRPTPSTRCCLRRYVCSMAWSFQAIDATLSK